MITASHNPKEYNGYKVIAIFNIKSSPFIRGGRAARGGIDSYSHPLFRVRGQCPSYRVSGVKDYNQGCFEGQILTNKKVCLYDGIQLDIHGLPYDPCLF
jgi:hypothetical protein